MTDHFATTVHNLLNATRGHGATPPEPSDGRLIRRLAEWVAIQRNNPFTDHTFPQLLAIDFGEATLAWVNEPTNEAKIAGFLNTRETLLQALTNDE